SEDSPSRNRLENYRLAIRGKAGCAIFHAVRYFKRALSVNIDPPKVLPPGAIGNKNNVMSIGRYYRLPVNAAVRSQLSRRLSFRIYQPKIFLAARVERIDKLSIRGPRHPIQTIEVCVSDLR